MKKIIILFTLIANFSGYAQNWELVTTNTTDEIKDIYFKDELVGFAVAGQGKILKTIDGGLNWNLIYENTELLQAQTIVTTDEKVYCFAQSYDGTVKKLEFSIDLNDFQVTAFNSLIPISNLNPISYNNIIYAAGVHYENGQFIPLVGQTTATGSTISNGSSDIYNNQNNLSASDGQNIFISTDGVLWSITKFHLPFLTSGPFHSYYDGINKMRTVTNYPCVVHISDDNGLTWSFNQINIQSLYFYFLKAEKVLGINLFTEENKIYYSTNSGLTFDYETVLDPVKHIYNFNSTLVFAYGNNGIIYKSTNGGGLLNIDEVRETDAKIEVYPSPSSDEIHIKYNSSFVRIDAITLLDINGKIIENIDSTSTKISLHKLPIGTYFLTFTTEKGIISKQIIHK